jgi:hypothetical protein
MSLVSQLEPEIVQAMKAREALVVEVLRGLKTALTNAEIANNRETLGEEGELKVLKTEVKRRRDAVELYKQGGRPELAEKEEQEIGIISKYLPAQMSEDDIRVKVKEVIAQLGATTPQDMGKVMGAAVKALGSAADGSLVSKIVKEELSK